MSSIGSEGRFSILSTINEEMVSNFDDMDLRYDLLRGIKDFRFDKPSAIQQRAIIPCIEGNDLLLEAKSGLGKTVAFVIAILQQIDPLIDECQALILVPNRETAQRIEEVVIILANHMYVRCDVYTDDTEVEENIRQLETGLHIVVGTAGRITHLIERKALRTDLIKTLVLAETNRILSNGVRDQIYEIQKTLTEKFQLILTMTDPKSEAVSELIKQLMREPLVFKEELTFEDIDQMFVPMLTEESKIDAICELLSRPEMKEIKAVIFCNCRKKVELIAKQLQNKNVNVSSVNSGMDWKQRQRIIHTFRLGSKGVLITAARIIDVPEVPLLINYDLPTKRQTYINRVVKLVNFGYRCGVVNFVVAKDLETLHRTERIYSGTVKSKKVISDIFSDLNSNSRQSIEDRLK